MATVADVVRRAYRKIGVAASDNPLTANEMAEGVIALNMMLSGWRLRGVNTGYAPLEDSDDFPLSYEFEEGSAYVLAGRLAPDYEAPQSFDADDWFRTIQAAFMQIDEAGFDDALVVLPSRIGWRGNASG